MISFEHPFSLTNTTEVIQDAVASVFDPVELAPGEDLLEIGTTATTMTSLMIVLKYWEI